MSANSQTATPQRIKTLALQLQHASQIAPCLSIHSDAITGPYANGCWEALLWLWTARWNKSQPASNCGTLWMKASPATRLQPAGACYALCAIGFAPDYLSGLLKFLRRRLGEHVSATLPAHPSLGAGWQAHAHLQNGLAWMPHGDDLWEEILC
jgi:hypothetical protein